MEKENSLRNRIIGLRLTSKEYKQIEKQLQEQYCKEDERLCSKCFV